MAFDRTRGTGIGFANRVYKPRALGCALSFIFVATTTYPGPSPLWVLMLLNAFIWPCLAYQLAVRARVPYRTELRNLLLDCVFAGGWVAAMQFSVLPSLLLLSMVAMNSVSAKGIRFMLYGLAANLLGMALAGAALGFEVALETPPAVVWACLPMLVIYPFVVGWTSYSLTQRLVRQQRALSIVSGFDERMLTSHNRWMYQLARVFLRCRCGSGQATVAHIRIDEFPLLRERHGALVADALSVRLGHLIKAGIRSTDLLCMKRRGEFLVLLLQARRLGAQSLTDRIEDGFAHCFAGGTGLPEARIRVGLAEFSNSLASENEWLRLAEQRSGQPRPQALRPLEEAPRATPAAGPLPVP